jgi:phosphoadenosine phosphosulfate reductase
VPNWFGAGICICRIPKGFAGNISSVTPLPSSSDDTAFPAEKVAASVSLLREAVARFGRVIYSSSLGVEAVVLMDLIYANGLPIDIFTVDTGRLPESTLELLDRLTQKYGRPIRVYYPDAQTLQNYVADHGINGFYNGLELRQRCCHIRKVEPFRRAVAGYGAWITGVRHQQSEARASVSAIDMDSRYGIYKVSPLLAWTIQDIWAYVRAHQLPYNPLHDAGFPSIGCEPCTRAIGPGQDERAGRWWWELAESRECGLQPRTAPDSLSDL